QAEDGIRDDLVTGVQTCALPILCPNTRQRQRRSWRQARPVRTRNRLFLTRGNDEPAPQTTDLSIDDSAGVRYPCNVKICSKRNRSEERRVGKGRRSRS